MATQRKAIGLWAAIMVLILLFIWTGGSPVAALTSEPKRFSYKVVEAPGESASIQTMLNEYGGAGWELVSVGMGNMTTPLLIFKKQP